VDIGNVRGVDENDEGVPFVFQPKKSTKKHKRKNDEKWHKTSF
jgi:hypothetical protein